MSHVDVTQPPPARALQTEHRAPTAPGPDSADAGIDWRVVRQLATASRERITASGGAGGPDRRPYALSVIKATVEQHLAEQVQLGRAPSAVTEQRLVEAIYDALFGLDRLEPLLRDPRIENIYVNGYQHVFVSYGDGRVERVAPIADSNEELIGFVQHLAAFFGLTARRFDPANPRLDLRLPDGSRLYAVMEVTREPCLSIRRNRLDERVFLRELVRSGTLTPQLGSFLSAAVRARLNIMIAGVMGAGKTTLLRAMANEIGPDERLVTIEDTLELDLGRFEDLHPIVVAMEARTANAEGIGAISIADLVYDAKRMNADRTIVGEVRGGEVVQMLSAMLHGYGSLSTIHVRDDRDTEEVFNQIVVYAQQASTNLNVGQINRAIAGALDLIVYIHADKSGDGLRRVVHRIREVSGLGEGDVLLTNEIFTPGPGGLGIPHVPISDKRLARLVQHGYDVTTDVTGPAEGWR